MMKWKKYGRRCDEREKPEIQRDDYEQITVLSALKVKRNRKARQERPTIIRILNYDHSRAKETASTTRAFYSLNRSKLTIKIALHAASNRFRCSIGRTMLSNRMR